MIHTIYTNDLFPCSINHHCFACVSPSSFSKPNQGLGLYFQLPMTFHLHCPLTALKLKPEVKFTICHLSVITLFKGFPIHGAFILSSLMSISCIQSIAKFCIKQSLVHTKDVQHSLADEWTHFISWKAL